jgi:hypothetical protein
LHYFAVTKHQPDGDIEFVIADAKERGEVVPGNSDHAIIERVRKVLNDYRPVFDKHWDEAHA